MTSDLIEKSLINTGHTNQTSIQEKKSCRQTSREPAEYSVVAKACFFLSKHSGDIYDGTFSFFQE